MRPVVILSDSKESREKQGVPKHIMSRTRGLSWDPTTAGFTLHAASQTLN